MNWLRLCAAAALASSGCGDDTGPGVASTTTAATGGSGASETGASATSGGMPTGTTSAGLDSSSGGAPTGDDAQSSSGGSESSTGAGINCADLAPIAELPNPLPPTGACGFVLPMPNEQCGAQPVPGSLVCSAHIQAFDPALGLDPDPTDWRCAQASSGGYCLELAPGLYTFCTSAITSLDDYETECVACLIEITANEPITVSWEMGPVWDVPPCAGA